MESTMAFAIRNSKQPISKHQELDDTEETLAIADDQLGFQNQITDLQNQILDLNIDEHQDENHAELGKKIKTQAEQSQYERTQKKSTEHEVLNDQTRAKFKKINARKETYSVRSVKSTKDCSSYEEISSDYPLELGEPCYNYPSARFLEYPYQRNDWICVQTERHPEIDKPKLYGKITQFKDLFTRQFQFKREIMKVILLILYSEKKIIFKRVKSILASKVGYEDENAQFSMSLNQKVHTLPKDP